jgi:alkylhydroperoxidase family enzyme
MSDIEKARKNLIHRVLEGEGKASREKRRAAFNNDGLAGAASALIEKVAKVSYKVTDDDIKAVAEAGLSEDQIFELVVCAAIGEATRQYETALAALASVNENG